MGWGIWGFTFLLFSSSVLASPRAALDFRRVIEARQIADKIQSDNPPRTVEEFLDFLPAVYRQYYVLQYRSRSRHQASPSHPRVILYGPDAKLLTAFSGKPDDPHFQKVEMIEYDAQESRFRAYEIDFTDRKPVLRQDPPECLGCHGIDLRPNWEPYSAWPGTYGSLHDRILPGSEEHGHFKKFIESFPPTARYEKLSPHFFMKTGGKEPEYYTVSGGVGSSSALSLLVSFLNRDRIAQRLVATAHHDEYRNAITAALLGCEDIPSYLPASRRTEHPRSFSSVLEEIRQRVTHDHERRNLQIAGLLKVALEFVIPHSDEYGMREPEIYRTAALSYLLENRGDGPVPMDRWSTGVHRTSYAFNDGVSGLENLIGHYWEKAYPANDPRYGLLPLLPVEFSFTDLGALPGAFTISSQNEPHAHGHANGKNAYPIVLYQQRGDKAPACAALKQ